jgi:hypothetical protein
MLAQIVLLELSLGLIRIVALEWYFEKIRCNSVLLSSLLACVRQYAFMPSRALLNRVFSTMSLSGPCFYRAVVK